jgi:hypothetical protein
LIVDMPERTVTAPNKVGSAYEAFWESFRAVVEVSNVTLILPTRPIRSSFLASRDSVHAVFTWWLYLKGLPCRRLSRSKRLDVIVKAMETFSKDSWKMTKSTVYVNYVVITGSVARLVQALHYDFVEYGQNDHPFFHVQLSDEPIPEAAEFELNLLTPAEPNECWVTTRIPTPDMTLASVLYCLIADHLGAGRFSQFAQKVQSIEDRLPPLGFESIRRSLERCPAHFKSSHWFAHMHPEGQP